MPVRAPLWFRKGHGYWFPYKGQKRPSGLWISMDTSATGRLVQATTNIAGKIVLRFPSAFGVGTWAETITTISGARPAVRLAKRSTSGDLFLAYEASGGIYCVKTINEGGTFSVAETITTAGKFPALDIAPAGERVHAWWVTGGAIKFRQFSDYGPMTAEVTAVASGAAEDAIALTCRSDGSYVLAYHNTSGSIISLVSTNGGQTWA